MAPNRGRNRQHEFADLTRSGVADFDPEEDRISSDDDDQSDDHDTDDNLDGREHYVGVGKSKLRQPKTVALGSQYRGSQVRREALEEEEEDGPFSHMLDGGNSSSSEEVESQDDQQSQYSVDEDGVQYGTDSTDLSDSGDRTPKSRPNNIPMEKEDLRQVISDDRNAAAKTLSQASKEDAQKGQAVKEQRKAFDSLLNTRMKLQKSLIATNTMIGTPVSQLDAERAGVQHALEAAETAAFKLWSSLNAFHDDMLAAQAGKKRKRSQLSSDSATDAILANVESQDSAARPVRNSVLEKWSNKAQGPSLDQDRLNKTKRDTITMVLQEQLADSSRLLARAYAPRSCAPLQLSQRVSEDRKIYDDADFYGLLLKELLEQKSQDSVAASNIDLGFQLRREAKTRRNVDTKASKGRKLRYTVHEKLQNFMAPEDRTTWGTRQADELFSSLFGQRLGLAEEDENAMLDDGVDGYDADEAGLLMFRG